MTTVVLINGEAQVGKTTLANQAMDLLNQAGRSGSPYSLVRPIYPAALAFTGRGGDSAPATDYELFKKQEAVPNLAGFTGRDIMIALGNAARGIHPYFLNTVFMNYVIDNPQVDTWFIENWGFEIEYQFFLEAIPRDVFDNVVTVHLDERATRDYLNGEQFDRDNRFCLRDLAMLVNPTAEELVKRVTGDYKMEFIFAPDEALTKLNIDEDSDWEEDGRPSFARLRNLTGRPDISDAEWQGIIDRYGFPTRQHLQRLMVMGNDAGEAVDEVIQEEQ